MYSVSEFDEDEDEVETNSSSEDNDDDDDEDYEDYEDLNNKKSVVIPDKKGIVGSGSTKRHHMIGYSIVSDKRPRTKAIKINLY